VADAQFCAGKGPERGREGTFSRRWIARLSEVIMSPVPQAFGARILTAARSSGSCSGPPSIRRTGLRLVEVIVGKLTTGDDYARRSSFIAAVGKFPFTHSQGLPGHVANRLHARSGRGIHLGATHFPVEDIRHRPFTRTRLALGVRVLSHLHLSAARALAAFGAMARQRRAGGTIWGVSHLRRRQARLVDENQR